MSLPLEVGVFDPPVFAGAYLDLLPEARDGDEAPGQRLFQEIEFDLPSTIKTPTMTIGFAGRSIRSQVVSTGDIRSASGMALLPNSPYRGLNLQRSGTPIVSEPGGLDFDYGCAHPVTTP